MGILEQTRAIWSQLWLIKHQCLMQGNHPLISMEIMANLPSVGHTSYNQIHQLISPKNTVGFVHTLLCGHLFACGLPCWNSDFWMIWKGDLHILGKHDMLHVCVCTCACWSGYAPPPAISWLLWPQSSPLHWSLWCYLMCDINHPSTITQTAVIA